MRRDPLREAEVIRRYRAKDTLQAIGTAFGISRERVRQIVIQAGETPRRSLRDLSAAIPAYQSGRSVAWIANELDAGHATVSGYLRRSGVAMRPVGRPRKEG